MWSVYTHLGIYFTHCELCIVKTFWYYILLNGLKVNRYLYLYIKHSNSYRIIKYIYTKKTSYYYIIYHISCTESTQSWLCLKSIACHSWNHWFASCIFFGGFQHFNYWRPGSKIRKCWPPGYDWGQVTLRLMEDTVDGSEILRETQLRLVVSLIFTGFLYIRGSLVFSINSSIGHHPFPHRNILIAHSHTRWVFDPAMLPKRDLP